MDNSPQMIESIDWTMWGYLLTAAVLELVGDLALKSWAETDRWPGLVAGLILYAMALVIFAHLLRRAELAVIFALWVGLAAGYWPLLVGCSLTRFCRCDIWQGWLS